jgi:putative membrane protein
MSLVTDLSLATLHHLAILTVFGALLAEFALLRLRPSAGWIELVARVDLAYGIAAGVALAVGAARVAWGLRGADYYLGNPVFWLKMVLFVAIGLISVAPTLTYLRWRRAARVDGRLPQPGELTRVRRWIHLQLALFVGLPMLAAMMARGVGY